MKKILITIDENLLSRMNEYVNTLGHGCNQSAFIREALEYYLTNKTGIKNIIKRRRLSHELEKTNQ